MGFVIALIIVAVIFMAIMSHQAAKKRRDAMQQLADSLPGMRFSPDHDYSFDERYPFLGKLCEGDDRYAYNILSGQYRGHPVMVFDYHYETSSTDSDGNSTTTDHTFSFFMLNFDGNFPELLITREGWGSRLIQFLGFDDIDFESAEFSRKFLVKSPRKKFAYDICHGVMMEYLMANDDLSIEIERNCLTLFFNKCLEPAAIPGNLDRLVAIRELFPPYLFST